MKRACTFYFDNRSLIIKYSIEACIWLYNRLLVWKGRSNVPSSKILMTIWSKVSGIIHDRLNSSAISGSVKRNKSYAQESRLSLNVLMRGSLSRDRRIYLYIYNFPTPLFFVILRSIKICVNMYMYMYIEVYQFAGKKIPPFSSDY